MYAFHTEWRHVFIAYIYYVFSLLINLFFSFLYVITWSWWRFRHLFNVLEFSPVLVLRTLRKTTVISGKLHKRKVHYDIVLQYIMTTFEIYNFILHLHLIKKQNVEWNVHAQFSALFNMNWVSGLTFWSQISGTTCLILNIFCSFFLQNEGWMFHLIYARKEWIIDNMASNSIWSAEKLIKFVGTDIKHIGNDVIRS